MTASPKLSALYLSSRPPFPPAGGRERLIAQNIRVLAAEYDLHVIVFCRKGESPDLGELMRMGCRSVRLAPMPGVAEIAFNLMARRRYSLQESLFFSRRSRELVRELAASGISFVVADMLRTGQYCEDLPVPKLIDLDDLLSERYRQFLANGHRQAVFGTFSKRVPKPLVMLEPLLRRRMLQWERKVLAGRETSAPHRFDVTLLTSSEEVARLRLASHATQIYPNPQATPLPATQWQCDAGAASGCVGCFFLGNMRTSQNLASLRLIAEEVMPVLIGQGLDIQVHVVGDFDDRATALARSTGDRITLHGFVSDYVPIARDCHVALLPVVEGTGVNTKVLDAMALGIPVITTRLGIKGIGVEHDREVLIADTPLDMHRMIARLAEDSTLGPRLSEAARGYIQRHHDPIVLHEQFRSYVAQAIECGRARMAERARSNDRTPTRSDVLRTPRAQEPSVDRSAT
ncbi:MAG: glycosyltransferase [Trinickia sp.]|jgi:hypothetical protein